MVWSPIAIHGPVFGLRAFLWTPFVFRGFIFRGPVFWTPLSSAGLFFLCLPRACLWTAFTLSSTVGLFLDPFVFCVFGPPLSSATVLFLDSLCLFRVLLLFSFGVFFGARFWSSSGFRGLVFGAPLTGFPRLIF